MANVGDSFRPGEQVPDSGLYVCDSDGRHRWSVQLRGERFPELPVECKGAAWVLTYKTSVAESRVHASHS